jgi:undecaprenyl-diphosphatase
MSPEPARLPLTHAIVLGALHGPAELLPVSSSAHVTLVPALMDWPYAQLPPDVRKAFEVALHTGTLVGLLALVPRPPLLLAVLATLPAAAAGFVLEHPIEQRLGGVRATAAGLVAGSAILVAADALAREDRAPNTLGVRAALVLGAAQAAALMPGLSRLGMSVAAGRALGLPRQAAFDVGRSIGLPLVAGATVLKGARLAVTGLPRPLRRPFAAGALAAAASTLAAAPLRRRAGVRAPAAERVALAALAVARARR